MEDEVILNHVISYARENAVIALDKAKKQESEKLKKGWIYKKCEDGVLRLTKNLGD